MDPERRNLLAMLKMEAANGVDTYWLAQPLRTAFKHSHSLVLEGGTDVGRQGKDRTLRYQINLNGNFSDGVMIGSLRNNYGGGAKLIYDTHKLQLTSDLQVGFTDTKDSPYGDFSTYTQLLPVFRIKDSHGDYFPSLSANNIPLYENYPWTGIGSNVLGHPDQPALRGEQSEQLLARQQPQPDVSAGRQLGDRQRPAACGESSATTGRRKSPKDMSRPLARPSPTVGQQLHRTALPPRKL